MIVTFLYARLKNWTYYVIALYGRAMSVCKMVCEIFDVSSPNLVHRSTRESSRPSLNWVTLTLFWRSQRSFKVTAYERWFPLNIWRNIWESLTEFWYTEAPVQGKRPRQSFVTLSCFRGHRGHLRQRHVKDGLCLIYAEILLVHRGNRARQRPILNLMTLTLFSRSRRSFNFI